MLSLVRKFLNSACATILYKSTVLPFFEYGNIFQCYLTQGQRNKLQVLQNRGLRVCLGRNRRSNVFDLHIDAEILPVTYRADFAVLKLMYEYSQNLENHDMNVVHTRYRDGPVLKSFLGKTNRFQNSMISYGVNTWNGLPGHLRILPTIDVFKANLKKHLWSVYKTKGS